MDVLPESAAVRAEDEHPAVLGVLKQTLDMAQIPEGPIALRLAWLVTDWERLRHEPGMAMWLTVVDYKLRAQTGQFVCAVVAGDEDEARRNAARDAREMQSNCVIGQVHAMATDQHFQTDDGTVYEVVVRKVMT